MLYVGIGLALWLVLMLNKRTREFLGLLLSLLVSAAVAFLIGAFFGQLAPTHPVHESLGLRPHSEDGYLIITYQDTSWYVTADSEQDSIMRENVHFDPNSKGILVIDGDQCENDFWSFSFWSLCDASLSSDVYVPEESEYILD